MALASGANFKAAMKVESTYGTAPSGNWALVPVVSFGLAAEQPFLDNPMLGLGREQTRPSRDVITVSGDIEVPVDLRNVGHWLKMFLGSPATTEDTGVYTHVFKSTGVTLPSYAIEAQHPDLQTPAYSLYTGVVANTMSLTWQPTGFPSIRIGVIGKAEAHSTSSVAGTPTTAVVTRFSQPQNTITKDASSWACNGQLTLNLGNGYEEYRCIGGGGSLYAITPGAFTIGGELTTRMEDLTKINLGANATLFDLAVGWTIDSSNKLTFEVEQCELSLLRKGITGPGGIDLTASILGSKDVSEGQALTVTLINNVASY